MPARQQLCERSHAPTYSSMQRNELIKDHPETAVSSNRTMETCQENAQMSIRFPPSPLFFLPNESASERDQ